MDLIFEIFESEKDKKWYWNLQVRFIATTGAPEIVAASNHGHETIEDCQRDIQFVKSTTMDTLVFIRE